PCLPNTPYTNFGSQLTLKINEWLAFRLNNDGTTNDDWFEVYNPDTNVVVLSDLVFADKGTKSQVATLRAVPPLSYIAPLGFVQIFCLAGGNNANAANEVDFSLSSTSGSASDTNNPADEIFIYASDRATVIDHVILLRFVIPNVSRGRVPDGGDTIIQLPKLTPQASNFGAITNVVVNEVLAHTDPPLEDAIELYNPTDTDADISNFW